MSSQSQFDHSSSSDQRKKEDEQGSGSRSRSRSRNRKNNPNTKRPTRKTIIKIPELCGPLIKFKNFMNNQPQKIDSDKAEKAYSKYKKDWENKQDQTFLIVHKNDAWFIEKYYPQHRDQYEEQRLKMIKSLASRFLENYKSGFYNQIKLTISETSLLGLNAYENMEEEDEANINSTDVILNHNINITKKPYFGFDPDYLTLFIKAVPKNIFKADIVQQVSKIPGFENVFMSEPLKKQNFTRYCWITFENESAFAKAEIALSGLQIKGQTLQVSKSNSKQKRIKVLKLYPSNRLQADVKATSDMIAHLDKECNITQNYLLTEPQQEDLEKRLDLNLLYLRKVYGYDYFTAQQFLDERQLSTKIGLAHLRVMVNVQQQFDVNNNLKKAQQQAEKRLEIKRNYVESSIVFKEEIEKMILGGQSAKEKQPWKCTQCEKKFVSSDYLVKHIVGKHLEMKKKINQRISQRSYCEDKNRITDYPQSPNQYQEKNYGRPYRGNSNRRGGYNNNRYQNNNNNNRRRQYQDLDDPKNPKETATTGRTMVNFLDI